jgi:VWFA-related protein
LEGYEAAEMGARLPVAAVCIPAPPEAGGGADRLRCILQTVVGLEGLATGELRSLERARITVLAERRDGEPRLALAEVDTGPLTGAAAWVPLAPVELPGDTLALALVIEAAGPGAEERGLYRGLWGGTLATVSGRPLESPQPSAVLEIPGLFEADPETAETPDGAAAVRPGTQATAKIIQLVPPRAEEVAGSTRIETLVSSTAIEKVVFFVDGQRAEEDDRPPFTARLNLARPATRQEIRVVAYGFGDELLGEDTLVVNDSGRPFRVRLSRVDPLPGGKLAVEATVSIPTGGQLDRLEIYRGDRLVETFRRAPFRAEVPGGGDAGPGTDFVRAVAYLQDGSSIDDVRLLGVPGPVEAVDVNLVEIFAVVTDREGRPITDLQKEDFQVTCAGQRLPVERFSYAEDVPLLLGLVIDSSGSMEGLMLEAKRAAGGFIGAILGAEDRAFVVDFDTRPRLAHPPTNDLASLFASFNTLTPDGFTAMYDSILFSLIQLGTEPGRKALVVLSDGDDYKSRYSPSRVIEDARKSAVPVYIIGLGEEKTMRRIYYGNALNDVAEKTGGRVYLVSPERLQEAYAQIEKELRSQYFLTFYAPEGLTDAQRRDVKVTVTRPGLSVRSAVGTR